MERYFLGGNTANGFYSLYCETLDALDNVVMLKGGAGTGKSTLMKRIAKEASSRGIDYEEWYCSGDPASLDGVYIPALSAAVVDATAPHLMDPKFPILKETIINLAECLNKDKLKEGQRTIEELINNKKRCFVHAYEHLNIALRYKMQSKCIAKETLDENALYSFAVRYCDNLTDKVKRCGDKNTCGRRLFSSAITPDGQVDYYDHLRDKEIVWVRGDESARYIFFNVLDRLTKNALSLANSLQPEFTDGIVVGNFAVVSDVGHLTGEVSEVVDLNIYGGACDRYAVDVAQENAVVQIELACDYLRQARNNHMAVEKFYVAAMDFEKVNNFREETVMRIFGRV